MKVGATTAAQMHAEEAEKSTSDWTIQDWLCHMKEEEERFFPLLPSNVSDRLMQDHNRFRMELSIYGDVKSVTLLGMHFDAEKMWCQYLMENRAAHHVALGIVPAAPPPDDVLEAAEAAAVTPGAHFETVCRGCGTVVAQCRCRGPKERRYVDSCHLCGGAPEDDSVTVSGASATGATPTSSPPWQLAATLAIGFGLAMLAVRYLRGG